MSDSSSGQIDNVMQEDRIFPPDPAFSQNAVIKSMDEYQQLYDRVKADPEAFWDAEAKSELHWFEPFDSVLQKDGIDVRWFDGGKTNISYN